MVGRFVLGLAVAVGGLCGTAGAAAWEFDGNTWDVEFVGGTGPNQAMLEVDFGTAGAPRPYLFGYRWDGGPVSGRDVLQALIAEGEGLGASESFFPGLGYFLNHLSYVGDGANETPTGSWPTSWWGYFSSEDGQTWTEQQLGYTLHTLSDGQWTGWAYQVDDPNEGRDWTLPALPLTHVPASAVPLPEPASLAVLALGAVALMRRRR